MSSPTDHPAARPRWHDKHRTLRLRLADLAERLGVPLHGDGSVEITGVAGIAEAQPGDLTFLGNPKYESFLATTRASAIIMPAVREDSRLPVLESPQPYITFLQAMRIFRADRPSPSPGVHPTAVVAPGVRLGEEVSVGPHVVIEEGAEIGARTALLSGCAIGRDVVIGTDCTLYPHVVLIEGTVIGSRVIIHAGAVLGSDGFGFARDGPIIRKIPQIGNVEVGDDVEIGANTTIDRATTGTTRIESGTKIDNLVMIAHNVQIGENSILCAQVGISGSTSVGRDVTIAGQVGVAGHIRIGDRTLVGAQSGVTKSTPADCSVSGYPAMPHAVARRVYAAMHTLPAMVRALRSLERRLRALEAPSDRSGAGEDRGHGGEGSRKEEEG